MGDIKPCSSDAGVATGMGLRGQCCGCGDGAMAVGTVPRRWEQDRCGGRWHEGQNLVCPHAAVRPLRALVVPSSSSQWSWHGGPVSWRGGSGSRSPGCAGAGGADSGTADLSGPAGWGVGCAGACPAPCLAWHPGFIRVSPPSDPQCRTPGQLLAWGWAPGMGCRAFEDIGVPLCWH